jgi:hypothetical protein
MAAVVGWRIVKEKHAKSAFSGEGARIFEGRWNSAGVRVVYCSENLAHDGDGVKEIAEGLECTAARTDFKKYRRRMGPFRALGCACSSEYHRSARANVSPESETSRFCEDQDEGFWQFRA